MVAANMRLIVSIVRPFWAQNQATGGSLSMEDLIQEGSLGLLKAVSLFDPERGCRFSTLASWWIRASVQRAIADKSRTIRLPAAKFRLLAKAKAKHAELQQRLERTPAAEELAAELQVSPPMLGGVLRHWSPPTSLEAPLAGADTNTLLDVYSTRAMGRALPLVESVEIELVRDALQRQLEETLTPIEARVLQLRYGLADGDCLSWKQIAERCDMPERDLHTLQARCLRRLRKTQGLLQLQELCHHAEWESSAP